MGRKLETLPCKGLLVTVRRSKTDQEGKRHQTAIVYGAP